MALSLGSLAVNLVPSKRPSAVSRVAGTTFVALSSSCITCVNSSRFTGTS